MVKKYLKDESCFLVNYSDVLTDLPLNEMIDHFHKSGKTGMFMVTPPQRSFHVVHFDRDNEVNEISALSKSGLWVNAGYFIFKNKIFDYLRPGEDLVDNALQQLVPHSQALSRHLRPVEHDVVRFHVLVDDVIVRGHVDMTGRPLEISRIVRLPAKGVIHESAGRRRRIEGDLADVVQSDDSQYGCKRWHLSAINEGFPLAARDKKRALMPALVYGRAKRWGRFTCSWIGFSGAESALAELAA